MAKTPTRSHSSRDRAVRVLTACYDGRRLARRVLDEMQNEQPLPPADAALAAELVLGVCRHRYTTEHLAAHFYRRRWGGVRPGLRSILSVAIYQLCWLDRVPDHAAVHEAVRHARRHGAGAASMVNAVLRRLTESRGPRVATPTAHGDSTRQDAPDPRRFLPLDASSGILFNDPVLPDPSRRPLEYLVAAYGHPPYLVERWHRRFKPAACRRICEAGHLRPPLSLRPNRLRTTPEEIVVRLKADGMVGRRHAESDAVLVDDSSGAAEWSVVRDGLCQPQDPTAQAALMLAPPRPGDFVLDLCAGVGTKATQAAELMVNRGIVLASDMDPAKLARAADSAQRLGITILRTASPDALESAIGAIGRPPDLILLDVPCTNTGVLGRRPDARYRATHRTLLALLETQREILTSAVRLAGPDTRILYVTCSLEQEENTEQIAWLRSVHPEWRLSAESLVLPDPDRGGGYAALLTRAAE